MKMCPEGKYIGDVIVRFENDVSGDDTALIGLMLLCFTKSWDRNDHSVVVVHPGAWENVNFGFVTGAKVCFEDPGGDDACLNASQFQVQKAGVL